MPSTNLLAEIIEKKKERLANLSAEHSLEEMREGALRVRRTARPHSFYEAVGSNGPRVNIIAEFKRASPSKGMIRADFSPSDAALAYARGGAAAVSVLTEEDYFKGSTGDLREVRDVSALPILRKDFIFDEFQVYEAAMCGADALLLIVAALDDATIVTLSRLVEETLGMDVLLEVHTKDEMERARNLGAKIIGVNNRDLHTFEVSLDTSVRLAQLAPGGALLVSESGLHTPGDIRRLQDRGYRAFLIGETLMRSANPEETLRELTGA